MKGKISIIGCGNIGQSLAKGFIKSEKINTSELTITKRNLDSVVNLKESGVNVLRENTEAIKDSRIIIIAVKPYRVFDIIDEIKDSIQPDQIILSLATSVKISELKAKLPNDTTVFRIMPNIASDVQESVTCICGESATEQDMADVRFVFEELGSVLEINEDLMEAATVLGACGVAYVMRFIRAMIQGGIQIGFDSETAGKIVSQTVKGAAELLIENKQHPEFEIDKVTTPKGCTIFGINEMEHNGFSSSLIKGIVTSFSQIDDPEVV